MRARSLVNKIWLSLAALCLACTSYSATIDLLVVYTPNLKSEYGGKDGVEALVQAAVASSNEAYLNSNTDITIRLVGLREVDYVESSSDMGSDIDALASDDNVIDEVLDWREEVGADLVYLFRRDSYAVDSVGIAYLLKRTGGSPSGGFGVVTGSYALGDLVLQHEIGHNLGAAHDPDNSDSGGIFDYSYGHRFTANGTEYRTLMAYRPGVEINLFSSPNLRHRSVPTGTNSADNARTVRTMGPVVAEYREYVPSTPTAVADNGTPKVYYDEDNDGFETVTLDGSSSEDWAGIASWTWTWPGGSASGEKVEVPLPVGTTTVNLTVQNFGGSSDTDSITITVNEFSEIADIVAGNGRTFILRENGTLQATGSNHKHTLGVDTETNVLDFTTVPLAGVTEVSSSDYFTLFRCADGSVYGIGQNRYLQLGIEGDSDYSQLIELIPTGVASIASGYRHSLFLMENGEVWGAGSNGYDQIGAAYGSGNHLLFKIFEGSAKTIAAGAISSAIIDQQGGLWISGSELLSAISNDLRPQEGEAFIRIIETGVSDVEAGSSHLVILMEDGSVFTAGENWGGELGIGHTTPHAPGIHKIAEGGVSAIAAGTGSTYLLFADGSVKGSGSDVVSLSAGVISTSGSLIELMSGRVSQLATNSGTTIILQDNGALWAAGNNEDGQFGNGQTSWPWEMVPLTRVRAPTRTDVVNVAPTAVARHEPNNIARSPTGVALVTLDANLSSDDWTVASFRWEWNGRTSYDAVTQIELPVGITEFSLTVTDDEGLSDTTTLNVEVKPFTKVIDITSSENRTFAIKEDGSLWAMGNSDNFALGHEYEQSELTQFEPIFGQDVIQVSSGARHTVILLSNGSVWGTGSNDQGQIGLGDTNLASGFTKILDSEAVSIGTGDEHTLILLEDGSLIGSGRAALLNTDPDQPVREFSKVIATSVAQFRTHTDKTFIILQDGNALESHFDPEVDEYVFEPWTAKEVLSLGSLGGDALVFQFADGSFGARAISEDGDFNVGPYNYRRKADSLLFPVGSQRDFTYYDGQFVVVNEEGKCYGYDKYSNPARIPLKPTYSPSVFFGSQVQKVSSNAENAFFLLEDGSLWKNNRRSSQPTLIIESDSPAENQSPISNAGPDIVFEDFLRRGYADVILDGSASIDDKFIKRWIWKLEGSSSRVYGQVALVEFPVGTTAVTLEVEDLEGLRHESTLSVTVQQTAKIKQVEENDRTSYFLLDNGELYVIGTKEPHLLTYSVYDETNARVPAFGISSFRVTNSHIVASDNAGGIWVGGENANGELGFGFRSNSQPLTQVFEMDIVSFAVGSDRPFAVKQDGSLWMGSSYPTLPQTSGLEDITHDWTKILGSGALKIQSSNGQNLLLKRDGSVTLWRDDDNLLGNGQLPVAFDTAQQIVSSGAKDIHFDHGRIFVTMSDGSLWGMGSNMGAGLKAPESFGPVRRLMLLSEKPVAKVATTDRASVWLNSDGSLWAIGSSDGASLGTGLYNESQITSPFKLISHSIIDFAIDEKRIIALRDDHIPFLCGRGGMLTSYGFHEQGWKPLVTGAVTYGDAAPVAEAGKDIVVYQPSIFNALVHLDGFGSTDDWAIKKWEWNINGSSYLSAQTHLSLPAGEHIATLTVEDHFGNRSSDTVNINVVSNAAFRNWLLEYAEEADISGIYNLLTNDLDGDGQSNLIEYKLGTNPNNQGSFSKVQILSNESGFIPIVEGASPHASAPILFSTDLINWSNWNDEIELTPANIGSDSIFFKIGELP